jgi:hypothetical protein
LSHKSHFWPRYDHLKSGKIAHRGDVGGLDRRIRKLPELAGSCPVPFLSDHTMRGNLSESESRPFLYKYGPCRATPCLSVGRFFTRFMQPGHAKLIFLLILNLGTGTTGTGTGAAS